MSYIIALDQGTTSSRAIVFNSAGEIVAVAQKEFHQYFPQPGWVEHCADEIWETQSAVAAEAMAKAGINRSQVAGIGITNQRETTILWDRKTGAPISHAIVWQDRRTAPLCTRLKADGLAETFRAKTGLVIDSYFSGTKIAWMLDNIEGARQRAKAGEIAVGTVDSWLAFKLTGGKKDAGALHITDVSNASRTLVYNINTGDWDDELLNILNVPRAMLPEVRPSSEIYGEVAEKSESGGISELAGVPIAGLIGDQQAATMGQLCLQPGLAKNTYGTGCFLLMNTGQEAKPSANNLLTTVAWQRGPKKTDSAEKAPVIYALEGSVFVGGAAVQWLRDGLGIIKSSSEVEALAASVPDSGGVVFVPALTGLGAPHWDPDARGTILGITRGTTAAHIARATLEGIAFQVADLVRAMEADADTTLAELRVDGGATADNLLMQIQADLLQRPVVRPTLLESTALGAAYMAGLATGFWKSEEELEQNWQIDRTFEPQITAAEADSRFTQWHEALNRAKNWN